MKAFSMFTQTGILIVACLLIGVLLGRFLDSKLGTSPWLLLFFSLLGMAAAFRTMYGYLKRK
jgi:ATP synthase protein I